MVSKTPAKSGGHRHRGSGDIMFLVCHVIVRPCDQMVKKIMGRSP